MAQVAFHRRTKPFVVYRMGDVLLHPTFAASTFVPGLGPVVMRYWDGCMVGLGDFND